MGKVRGSGDRKRGRARAESVMVRGKEGEFVARRTGVGRRPGGIMGRMQEGGKERREGRGTVLGRL